MDRISDSHTNRMEGGTDMALITISGGMGTGVERIARQAAQKAGLELYDDQKLHEEALRMGIRKEDLKGVDEKAPGFFESLRFSSELYLDILESVVYSVSKKGQGILVGHGSQILLREFGCALHVLVHASEDFRVRQVMEELKVSDDGARRLISKSDSERRGFLRFAFRVNQDDVSLYDLLVNTEKLGVEGAAEVIVNALRLPAIHECSLQAMDTMERMMLSKRVEAALHRSRLGFYAFSTVEVLEKGVVEVAGMVGTMAEKNRLIEVIKAVPGVIKVKDEISVLPHAGY
jgi:cytidylate kinase